ncbi:MAG: hypothetical protein ABJE66_13640 [Deltaproteobacteria bacterium]
MRIAISSPMRWATGLAAVATIALVATRSPVRDHGAMPVKRMYADANRATRAGLSQMERELDALTDRVTEAVDAVVAAETEDERRVARAELARLQTEIEVERQLVTERARQLRVTLEP